MRWWGVKGKTEVAKGKTEVAKGKAEVEKGKTEVAKGKAEVAKGKAEVAKGKTEVAKGEAEVAKGKTEVAKGKTEVAKGKAEVAKGKTEVAKGKTEVAKSKTEAAKGRTRIESQEGGGRVAGKKGKIGSDYEALRRTKRYKQLRQAMLDDLAAAGIARLPYTEWVEQYMSLWIQLQLLEEDVSTRGVKISYQNGASQKGTTENKSVTASVQVGRRMDDILNRLGYIEVAKKQRTQVPVGGEDAEL